MGSRFMVALPKIKSISPEEIAETEKKLYIEDQKKVAAFKELQHLIKEIGVKRAYRLSGYVSLLRGYKTPYISKDLFDYLKSCGFFKLRNKVSEFMIQSYGGVYSTFALKDDWKRNKRGFFWFYWCTEKDFVNVYTIQQDDLPLYVNKTFKDKEDRSYYLKRMRGEK